MRLDWRGALGILLSAALLWWTLKDENVAAIWQALSASNLWLFLLATVVCTLIFPLRALRWRTILAPVAGHVAYGPLWRATSIGMMVNNVVPARAGEFARALALAREVPNVPFATALASLAVDRMFDAVVVLLLTFVPLLSADFPRNASASAIPIAGLAKTAIASIVLLLVALYALALFPTPIIRAFEVATRKVAPGIERRGATALAAFADGLGVLRHPGRFVAVFLWTMAHWIVQTLSIWIGFLAMDIRAPFGASLLLNGISSFASVLPAAPGFFGQFEIASKVSLRVYGIPDTQAISWALGYHILTFIPITVIGAVYAARLGVSFREMMRQRNDTE